MPTEPQIYVTGNIANPNYNPQVLPPHLCELIMQNKPNFPNTQMNVTFCLTKQYKNQQLCRHRPIKPKNNFSKLKRVFYALVICYFFHNTKITLRELALRKITQYKYNLKINLKTLNKKNTF